MFYAQSTITVISGRRERGNIKGDIGGGGGGGVSEGDREMKETE